MQKILSGFFGHERSVLEGRKGHCAGGKGLDIKDNANVSLELN